MCYYILPSSGIPIARSLIQQNSPEKRTTEAVKQELSQLDESIKNKLKVNDNIYRKHDAPDYVGDKHELIGDTPHFEPIKEDTPEADEWDPESFDK